jgi:putative protein-disulfide isomerase
MNRTWLKPTLIYIYDPMCSWCWGYQATWQLLQENLLKSLSDTLDIQYFVGGLAPDSDELMPEAIQMFLQKTWHKINQQLGTEFNFDFWQICQPRRSTYPACRAVIAAREQACEQEMLLAIQQGYYLQAKNPSNNNVLIEFAASIGLDVELFTQALTSDRVNQQLSSEISTTRNLPSNGFPSLVLAVNGQFQPIDIDYKNWQSTYENILSYLPTIDN